jgi:hypothetical protein
MAKKTLKNKTTLTLKKVNTRKNRNTLKNRNIRKNRITGGANCPKIGFSQHIGECWHDGLSTALLYSDGLSEYHQKIFDDPHFDIEKIISTAREKSDKRLLPINIDDKDYDKFERLAKDYIESLYKRYMNDKLPTSKQLIKESSKKPLISPEKSWASAVKTRVRSNSTSMSLSCVESLFEIANINSLLPIKYTEQMHGGNPIHTYETIATVNYFLTSYNNHQYVEMSVFDIRLLIGTIGEILDFLKSTRQKIKTSHAVLLSLQSQSSFDAHLVSLITCEGKNYFYDDNGVYDSNYKLSAEFDWRPQLCTLFDKIITDFENIKKTGTDDDFEEKIKEYLESFNMMSILKQLNLEGVIGRFYLDYSFLNIYILELKNITDKFSQLQFFYNFKSIVSIYDNQRMLDFVNGYLLKIENKYDKVIEYFEMIASFNAERNIKNRKLFDVLYDFIKKISRK